MRVDVKNFVRMRGVLAVNEDGVLGVVTSEHKTDGAYAGLDLRGDPWSVRAPTQTAGLVSRWAASGLDLHRWLEMHGCRLEKPLPPDADSALRRLVRDREDVL